MTLTTLTRVCSIALMLVPLAAGLAADSAAGKTAAKVLLEKGWKKPAGKDALVDHENLERPPLAGDSSVLAAKWLVLMYQSRWDDALAGLEKFLKAEPAEDLKIHALRAKAWILTVKKDYQKAMVVADQLSQAAAPNPQVKDKAVLEAQDEAIAFVGRLAGFVESVGDNAGDQAVRAKLEVRVLERLDEARKGKFKAAKTEVLEEFERLVKKAAEAKDDSKADAEEEKQKKLAGLSEEDAKLSEKANEVKDKGKKLDEELKKRLEELRRMDSIVLQEMTTIQSRYSSLSSEIRRHQGVVDTWEDQEARNRAKNKDRAYSTPPVHVQQAKSAVRTLRQELTAADYQLQLRRNRRMEIEREAIAANGGAMWQGQKLAGEQSKIDRDKLKNANIKKRTDRMKAGIGGKALSAETEARAFSTYDTIPLEELRENLLEKVK